MPEKKWYEQETRWDLFLTYPVDMVRNQMISTLSTGGIKRKGFWNSSIPCTGNITGNFMDMNIRIPTGKGYMNYRVFGELAGYSNGCLIQVAVRDAATFSVSLIIAGFIAIICFMEGIVFGLFAAIFFGGFGCLAVLLQHTLGISAVKRTIREMVGTPGME